MRRVGSFLTSLLLILLFASAAFASGEGAATLYNQGNALYAKGDFEGALKSYRHALEQRVADPRLEQNIGSAYLRTGDVGRAIYHFERGLMLEPRNDDLKFNLDYAKTLRLDEVPEGGLFVSKLFEKIVHWMTPGEWIGLFAILFVLVSVSLLLLMVVHGRARPVLFWSFVGLLGLLILISPFFATNLYQHHFVKRGIVVGEKVQALTGPGGQSTEAFVVHAGMPCRILERRSGWVRVGIPTGLSGWMKADQVRVLEFQ
jgi:hypothetical protein